jgi:hypothetical protein
VIEVFEGGCGGNDQEAAVAQPFDGSFRKAIKEVDPQYPMEVGVEDLTNIDRLVWCVYFVAPTNISLSIQA